MKRLAVVLLLALALVAGCSTSQSPSLVPQKIADSSQAAIKAAGGAAAVYDIHANSSGTVYVRMALTKEAIGGDGGDAAARDAVQAVAGIIIKAVPEVKTVYITDANDAFISDFDRKQ